MMLEDQAVLELANLNDINEIIWLQDGAHKSITMVWMCVNLSVAQSVHLFEERVLFSDLCD